MTRSLWVLLVSLLTILGSALWFVLLVVWLQVVTLVSRVRGRVPRGPEHEAVRLEEL